jgi:hypothetical protein
LSRAIIRLHVDINVGDPVWPEPQQVHLPRLLGGEMTVRAYPFEMVLAEKIVTAIARGTANIHAGEILAISTFYHFGMTLRAIRCNNRFCE